MSPTINLLMSIVMPLLYRNVCISAPNLNIFTIISALESLEYDPFSRILHLFLQREITFFLRLIERKET